MRRPKASAVHNTLQRARNTGNRLYCARHPGREIRDGRGKRTRAVLQALDAKLRVWDCDHDYVAQVFGDGRAPKMLASDPLMMVRALYRETDTRIIARMLDCYSEHVDSACAVLLRFTVHVKQDKLSISEWRRYLADAINALRCNAQEWSYD